MANKNPLLQAPPYPVEQALKRLGENLRVARIRRGITIEEAAEKIGTGRRAVMEAEKGKASTASGVYVALLWAYDLLGPFSDLANPATDEQGLALASAKENTRVRKSKGLSGDF
ncbi:transcriptional regulator with XRE-family HTH domain [Rhodopseudomonas rhenobacensis]|uniref:Transcriptional regulator with XRE-family HTH domain n=1 Tax=Rhodopseudomonas rhenobacensis TaxID=87461 RepID=A0A7W7Z0Y5_9BRAD|nr:XRE family transcriptional regulator [Rhodopseudomonas rhenobacensis]MBB5045971.1 transcriptional regulator with XRE-family HTH domain [Rhodopseudomonas rhenobacensis]